MYKPDEDIDRLSRDAAEHYNAPGQPSWDALQQILDKELPQEKEKKRRGFFFFWLLLGLSVAGTGLWYGITINNKNPKTTTTDKASFVSGKKKITTVVQPENANSIASADKTAEVTNATASNDVLKKTETPQANAIASTAAVVKSNNTDAISTAATKKKVNGNNGENKTLTLVPVTTAAKGAGNLKDNKNKSLVVTSGSHKSLLSGKKIKSNTTSIGAEDFVAANNQKIANKKLAHVKTGNQILAGTDAGINGTKKKNKHGGKKGSTDNTTPQGATTNEILTGIAAKDNNIDKTKGNTETPAKNNEQDEAVAITQDTTENKTPTEKPVAKTPALVVAEKKDSTVAAKKKSKSKAERAINFGILAGVDESTVKFTNSSNAGYNIGLTGGYQFSKHWSVSTGVIYTKKNYSLNGKDFHPPAHYWTQYVDLQSVEGYCKMWEIPLQAKYTFNPGAKTAFFASAGLSSYFMTRQYYDYSYKNSTGWPMTGVWGTDSTFKHIFSILDLSAGFEKRIGKHMNLQVEPYAKIPLGGVGFGNIRLSSFGINFSIQYRHPVKR